VTDVAYRSASIVSGGHPPRHSHVPPSPPKARAKQFSCDRERRGERKKGKRREKERRKREGKERGKEKKM